MNADNAFLIEVAHDSALGRSIFAGLLICIQSLVYK
jgi:hypothetical protein